MLAPGWAAVRLTTRRSAPTDLAWALPAGLVIALAVWVLGRLLDVHLSSPLTGAGVALALVAAGRALDRRRGGRAALRVTPAATIATLAGVGAAMVVATGWMWQGLVRVPPVPDPTYPTYHQDLVYHTALAGELRRNLVPGYPMVDGEPLSYHWFFHALAAQLGGNGLHDVDVVMRLLPATLVLGLVGLAAAVGHQVTGHAAGAVGAALGVAALGPVAGDPWAGGPLPVMRTYWQLSPTATLGWVVGLALVGTSIAVLRRRAEDLTVPTVLLLAFAVASAGAKSAELPVVIAGVGLAMLARLVLDRRRAVRWRVLGRYLVLLLGLTAVMVLALVLLYPGSYGLRWSPFEYPGESAGTYLGRGRQFGSASVPGIGVHLLRVWAVLCLGALGAVVLLRRRPRDPSGWIAIGALVAALGAVLLLQHPGRSQLYFVVAAVPITMALSGAGLADLVRSVLAAHRRRRSRATSVGVVALLLTVVAGCLVALLLPRVFADRPAPVTATPDARVRDLLLDWALPPMLLLGSLVVVGVLGWLLVRPALAPRGPGGAAAGMGGLAVASAGLVALAPALTAGAPTAAERQAALRTDVDLERPRITRALFDVGAHLRTAAGPDDVIATNRVFNGTTRVGGTDNRDFSVSALSGLRTDVSGFGYAPRMLEDYTNPLAYFLRPFWDEPRLLAEQALITDPSQATLDAAFRDQGIRWIVADERSGPVSPELADLATPVLADDGVALYRLRPPG